ncbi:MAG: DoxX family protein [Planctomycetaceae bacterium]
MSRSVRKISLVACLLLVTLRVAIGWQFLYEGLWKLGTQKTAKPWSAEGYLLNSRGPFRDSFRTLVSDPDGLARLDYDEVVDAWTNFRDRFVAHYSSPADEKIRLTAAQQSTLDDLLRDGPGEFRQPLAELPAGVDLNRFKPLKYKPPENWYLRYNAQAKRLETNLHLTPDERDALLRLGRPEPADTALPEVENSAKQAAATDGKYEEAIRKLYDRSGKLSLKERLQVLLREDPDRVGLIQEKHAGTIDHERAGKKQVYLHLLSRYEQDLKQATAARSFLEFEHAHLDRQWREIQEKKAELLGPVDALGAELRSAAYKLLTPEQVALGPVPEATDLVRSVRLWKVGEINVFTMWSLIVVGGLLMAGLFSRLSALVAAGLLLLFYLPLPPWPGVPEPAGPEHSLIVNKNLIECIACLALASLPTGRWIGLDALVRRFIFFRKSD